MPTTLLQTKLFLPPVRPNLVARERLLRRLDAGLSGRLTLVCAPAGFGKTTLVSGWLRANDEFGMMNDEWTASGIHHSSFIVHQFRVAWLSLDRGDNDPTRLLTYVIAALQQAGSQAGETALAMLQAPQPLPLETVLTSLLNDLAAQPQPLLLVLDDYHTITAPAVHEALAFLLEHQPATLHLVITSRSDPPLPLARLRARGEVNEIRARDLRFTAEEARDFLQQTMHLALPEESVELLEQRTEGWIAGLQLAAHSLQFQEDQRAFLADFAGDDRFVADYLIEEVLALQPAEVQAFLVQTSILDNLAAPLCDAVTGRGDSQAILARLEQANLFIAPLDNRRQWYRYHQLFADLLRERLGESGLDVAALHRRASGWCQEHNLPAQAIEHALAAGDPAAAIRLIEANAGGFFLRSELTTLTQWWPRLPEDEIVRRPRLCMLYGWAWMATGHGGEAERCMQLVEVALGQPMAALLDDTRAAALSPAVRDALVEVAAVRMNLALGSQDFAAAVALAHRIRPYLASQQQALGFNPPVELQPIAAYVIGLAQLYGGQLDEAAAAIAETWELSQRLENMHLVAAAAGYLARIDVTRGRLRQAADTCQRALRSLAELPTSHTPMTSGVLAAWGHVLYERNDLRAARQRLEEAVDLSETWDYWDGLLPGCIGLARLCRTEGNWHGVFAALDRASARAHSALPDALSLLQGHYALYQAERGDLEPAQRWLGPGSIDQAGPPSFLQEEAGILSARVALALPGRTAEAGRLLAHLLAGAEAGGRWGRVIEILALQAVALHTAGNPDAELAALGSALRLAEPEGYVRTFTDAGGAMAGLLERARRQGMAPEYCGRLLAVMGGGKEEGGRWKVEGGIGARGPAFERGPEEVAPEPLSEREVEVLQLLAEGLTNKEIARRLYVTEGTVKVHAHNIYAKLGAANRSQAVARGRKLGFIV